MPPTPLYDAKSATPAYGLRYSWTGWPSSGRFPSLDTAELLRTISPLWESAPFPFARRGTIKRVLSSNELTPMNHCEPRSIEDLK